MVTGPPGKKGYIKKDTNTNTHFFLAGKNTLSIMDSSSSKQVKLVLASASISTIPEKFLREIIEFTGSSRRDICKRLTFLADRNVQRIALKQAAYYDLVSIYGNPEPVKRAIFSYASKCLSLRVVDMQYDCF